MRMYVSSGVVSGASGLRCETMSAASMFSGPYDSVRGATSSRSERTSAASCSDWNGVRVDDIGPPSIGDCASKI